MVPVAKPHSTPRLGRQAHPQAFPLWPAGPSPSGNQAPCTPSSAQHCPSPRWESQRVQRWERLEGTGEEKGLRMAGRLPGQRLSYSREGLVRIGNLGRGRPR